MPTRRLIIDLDAGILPRGRVVGVDGKEIAFAGWIELAAALEQARGVRVTAEHRFGAAAGSSALRGASAQE